jgi:hypothetical protein
MVWALLDADQANAVQEIIKSGSERIMAVVGGAILDESLRRTLEERLRKDSKQSDFLFDVGGPIGNLRPKICLAYQLYAIEKPTRKACEGIAEIRNFFAHNLVASFDSTDKAMTTALTKLTLHDGRTHYPFHQAERDSEYPIEPVRNQRERFIVNLKLVLVMLMRDRSRHVTWSNHRLPGWSPFAPEEMPAA